MSETPSPYATGRNQVILMQAEAIKRRAEAHEVDVERAFAALGAQGGPCEVVLDYLYNMFFIPDCTNDYDEGKRRLVRHILEKIANAPLKLEQLAHEDR